MENKGTQAKVAIRIPGYAPDTTVKVQGKPVEGKTVKGYFILPVETGETLIELDIPLAPRVLRTNPNVRENIGKAAVMKGPLVYCMEEQDNGSNLPAYYIDRDPQLREEYCKDLLQ